MSWLKIDDGLFLHPKWVQTPAAARALWVTALSYCGKFANGGLIHPSLLPILGGSVDDAEALVASGLWERRDDSYQIHDFAEYNESSTPGRREHISDVRAEAGRAGGIASGESRRSRPKQTRSKTKQNEAPGPGPEPVPEYIPTAPDDDTMRARPDAPVQGVGRRRPGEAKTTAERVNPAAEPICPAMRSPAAQAEGILRDADQDPARWHWRGALARLEAETEPASPGPWRLKVLRNWAEGDGAPDPPPPPGQERCPAPRRKLTAIEERDQRLRQRCDARAAARLERIAQGLPPDDPPLSLLSLTLSDGVIRPAIGPMEA